MSTAKGPLVRLMLTVAHIRIYGVKVRHINKLMMPRVGVGLMKSSRTNFVTLGL